MWDAVGALGDWASALAGAGAIWWGVYQTRMSTTSKARTTYDVISSRTSGEILRLFAINDGRTIIRFTWAGVRWVGSAGEYIISKVYYDPPKEPVEPGDSRVLIIPTRELRTSCLEAGFGGIKEFVFEFMDTQHKIYSGRFKFNIDTLEVIGIKKTL